MPSDGARRAAEAFLEAARENPAAFEATSAKLRALGDALRSAHDDIKLADQQIAAELGAYHFAPPTTMDEWKELALIVEIPWETVDSGKFTQRQIYECALAWGKRQAITQKLAAAPESDGAPWVGPKSAQQWAAVFKKRTSTLWRWRRDNKIRCRGDGQNFWIHPDDVKKYTPRSG